MQTKKECIQKGLVLIFAGPPGSGKGTYGSMLAKKWGMLHVSMGDLIRAKLAAWSSCTPDASNKETFQISKERVERGLLIQDAVASELCKQHITNAAQRTSCILDGFPRNLQQAEALHSFATPHACINFHLPAEILLKKLLGRRICATCSENFNVASVDSPPFKLPPILPKKECLKCGGNAPLIQRDDDTEETIQKRLDVYEQLTKPMLNHYDNQGVLLNFEVVKGIEDIPRLEETITSFLRKKYHEMPWVGVL